MSDIRVTAIDKTQVTKFSALAQNSIFLGA